MATSVKIPMYQKSPKSLLTRNSNKKRKYPFGTLILASVAIWRIGPSPESEFIFESQVDSTRKLIENDLIYAVSNGAECDMDPKVDLGRLTFEVAVPNRQAKFRELIILIAEECLHDPTFGATKLNKLMWRTDFTQFFRTGIPVTGAKYQRLPNGPAPLALVPVRRELINEGAIEEELHNVGGFDQRRIVVRRSPDLSVFSQSELDLVRSLVKENWGRSAKVMSDASHGLAWQTAYPGGLIPYEAEYISDDAPTHHDIDRTRELVAEFGMPDGI